ncbi:MAG: hypothetical protein DME22_24215 [Verrucomicrobia bacterium]|nr:MAG: hypothetical protein DME22_24215 [Verrucomicrobiota bacterium]PYJ96679.1 MAG: hypothetical protein DME23_19500 [Verrucomicrobiota bacterium]
MCSAFETQAQKGMRLSKDCWACCWSRTRAFRRMQQRGCACSEVPPLRVVSPRWLSWVISIWGALRGVRRYGGSVEMASSSRRTRVGNAQFNLSYCYERGLGVEIDFVQAAKWYRLAAQQTHLVAIGSLGAFYMEGRGVPRDYDLAERLFKQAMEGGNVRAKLNLGQLYVEKGYRTNMFESGIRLIHEAAEAGDFRGQAELASLCFYGKGENDTRCSVRIT